MLKMNVKKLYYGLVSLISVIAIATSSWILLSSVLKMYLISDKEYIEANHWIIDSCKYVGKSNSLWGQVSVWNYSSKQECIKDKTKQILLERKYNFKMSIISSLSVLIVFLILFVFHYPRFKKLDN